MKNEETVPSDNTTRAIGQWPRPAEPHSLVLRDWPRMLGLLTLVTIATGVSVAWLDLPLAQFIKESLSQGPARAVVETRYPDVLDLFVAVVTVASWISYVILRRKHAGSRLVCLLQVIGTALPFSYTAKDILKAVFGRVNTRFWLDHPQHFAFHWLDSGHYFFGFPSGHMTVICAFVFATIHYYPRLKIPGWIGVVLLGAALIVSEYHFLGDVIAGAFVGYLAFVAARELPGAVPASPASREMFRALNTRNERS